MSTSPSGASLPPRPAAHAAEGPSFWRRNWLRVVSLGLFGVHLVLRVIGMFAPPPWTDAAIGATILGFGVVPLLAWEICREIDRAVRLVRRAGFLAGFVRISAGVVFVAFVPLAFTRLEGTGVPAALRLVEVFSVVVPVAVASGLVLVGMGVADVLSMLTRGFAHLSTRLMLLLLVSTLGTVAWLGYVGPEGRRMLMWAVERGHLQHYVGPLLALEDYAGAYLGGIAGAVSLQLPFILLLAWRFGRNATDELADLGRAFRRVGAGDFDRPVPVSGNDEVAKMKRGFNQMLALARERRFLETAFGRYVSPVLLERLKGDRERALGHSESRTATVLFTDIRGFTAMSAEMSLEQVIGVLNTYISILIETVAEYDGYINKFIGDAILVVWNAPLEQPDHLSRAVRCAAAMQAAIARANEAGEFGGRTIRMGVGINTGPLVVGQLGNERQAEFTVIGDTVNVASRVCGHAAPGQIAMTAVTCTAYLQEQPDEEPCFSPLGARELKGKGAVELVEYVPAVALDASDPRVAPAGAAT